MQMRKKITFTLLVATLCWNVPTYSMNNRYGDPFTPEEPEETTYRATKPGRCCSKEVIGGGVGGFFAGMLLTGTIAYFVMPRLGPFSLSPKPGENESFNNTLPFRLLETSHSLTQREEYKPFLDNWAANLTLHKNPAWSSLTTTEQKVFFYYGYQMLGSQALNMSAEALKESVAKKLPSWIETINKDLLYLLNDNGRNPLDSRLIPTLFYFSTLNPQFYDWRQRQPCCATKHAPASFRRYKRENPPRYPKQQKFRGGR